MLILSCTVIPTFSILIFTNDIVTDIRLLQMDIAYTVNKWNHKWSSAAVVDPLVLSRTPKLILLHSRWSGSKLDCLSQSRLWTQNKALLCDQSSVHCGFPWHRRQKTHQCCGADCVDDIATCWEELLLLLSAAPERETTSTNAEQVMGV